MNDYSNISQFFLGLLEGDGSIQVNSWRKKTLQFPVVIKLKYDSKTYDMCVAIRNALGFMNLHVRNNNIILVDFNNWLCGFIEAEGCFCIRTNGNLSFSIAQKNEMYLLQAIKTLFQMPNIVRVVHNRVYVIETYKTSVLTGMACFLDSPTNVGLLGLKNSQFQKFKRFLEVKKSMRQNNPFMC